MRSIAEPAAELDARYSNEEAEPRRAGEDALTPAVVYAFGKGEPFTPHALALRRQSRGGAAR